MKEDKCPKCGAEVREEIANKYVYECKTEEIFFVGRSCVRQSDHCRTRCELANTKAQLERLKEAAKALLSGYEVSTKQCHGDAGLEHIEPLIDTLGKVVEQ